MNALSEEKPKGMLEGIPSSYSALERALEVSNRTVAVGFDWDTLDEVWDKVEEECQELKEAYKEGDLAEIQLEMGDVLFSLVNVARKMGINAEESLHATCDKFTWRWETMEKLARLKGQSIDSLSMEELQAFWDSAKAAEKKPANKQAKR
ncbi:MAG: MazG nucleotide pyrophosphohydrolase domain-containing protein [Anaerotardibacter sp.]